jgi:antitoxin (DNA-binding transcriptional repressor) of toxin-antitoxin stability system
MIEYVVTLHGEPVAVIRPLDETERQRLHEASVEETLADMRALAQDVAAAWTSDKSAVELVEEQRR